MDRLYFTRHLLGSDDGLCQHVSDVHVGNSAENLIIIAILWGLIVPQFGELIVVNVPIHRLLSLAGEQVVRADLLGRQRGKVSLKHFKVSLLEVHESENLVTDVGESVPFGLGFHCFSGVLCDFVVLSVRLVAATRLLF